MTRVVALAALLLLSCNKNAAGPSGPSSAPIAEGPLVTAGARCHDGKCACRALDAFGRPTGEPETLGPEKDVTAGMKRFEFRSGRGFDKTRITIESRGTLVKDTASPDPACGYVDLPPGEYRVVMRVEAADKGQGIQPRLLVEEYGSETHDWYDTFSFECGNGAQRCIKDDMAIWFDKARAVGRGIFDKCGSTRVSDIAWHVEHSPEQTLEDLTLEFKLHVYKFPPRFRHGTPTCKGLAGGRAAESELAAPDAP